MRGLYVHIPFCESRCHYCISLTAVKDSEALRERFFKALSEEIKHARKQHGPLSFDTLYLGGGTPSSLKVPEIKRLISEVHSAFSFNPNYEFTCEFNPGDGDQAKLDALHEMGVNRISLGCQAFQDKILQRIGRRHTVKDTLETLAKIKNSGIFNTSLDLMMRLPGQTLEDFCDSARQCIQLGASQVSLYDLEIHEGTPFGQLQKAGKLDLPHEEIHAQMYSNAVEILTEAGYEHYEISNFAKPGLASRHNLIYWQNQEYLGLGPSAFSYLNGIRFQFAPDLERYFDKIKRGDWKNDIEDKLSEEEKETETFAMSLRLREGVCPGKFPRIYPALKERVDTLCKEGLMEVSGKNIRLTARGKFLAEDVFSFLLAKAAVRPS